jgi:hypothetical protein
MARGEIDISDDAGAVLEAGEVFLTRAPVEHNLVLWIRPAPNLGPTSFLPWGKEKWDKIPDHAD